MTQERASGPAAGDDDGWAETQREPKRTALTVALLFALAVLAYANAIFHPFVYDDNPLVVKNAQIRSLGNLPRIIGFGDDGFRFNTRWTRTASYTLEYAAAGLRAPVYHATNIVLHGLVGLLVFALIRRLSDRFWLAWWSAALFVVHPITSEVVAHVAGRRELLATVFSLCALLVLERYTRSGGLARLVLALAALYLAAFSKELAVMTPAVFILADVYRKFGRSRAGEPGFSFGVGLLRHCNDRKWLYGLLALVTVCLAGSLVFLSADIGLGGKPGFYDTTAGGLRAIDRASLVGLGFRLILVPVGQSVDYSFDALGLAQGGLGQRMLMDLVVLALGLGLAVGGLWRRNWAGFAGVWFLLFYLPHLGIIPWHEVFAERFLYLPAIGVSVGLAAAGLALARHWPRTAVAGGTLVLALLTTGSLLRSEVWGSNLTLWQEAVSRYPNCARAHKALADAYITELRPDLALDHYKEAVRILPGFLEAHTGVAVALTARREYGQALEELDATLRRWPNDAKTLNAKAYIHETLGELGAAMETYQRAVDGDPTFADGYNNLARMYVQKGDLDAAIRMYEKALQYNPAMVTALRNLAIVYREGLGDQEKAAEYDEQARRLAMVVP